MSLKKILIITVVIALLTGMKVSAQNQGNKDSVQTKSAMSSEEAVAKAIDFLGIQNLKDFNIDKALIKSESVLLHDSTTPFIGETMNNRQAWEVVFQVDFDLIDERYLNGDSTFVKKKEHYKDIHVFLDKEDGTLYKIVVIKTGVPESDLPVLPPAKDVEENFAVAEQQYHGIPDNPKITFIEALSEASGNVGSFKEAVEITALLVNYSNFKIENKPVWDLHLYGITHELGLRRRNIVPEYQTNHLRIVIDADTGKFLFAVGSPHPLEK